MNCDGQVTERDLAWGVSLTGVSSTYSVALTIQVLARPAWSLVILGLTAGDSESEEAACPTSNFEVTWMAATVRLGTH